MVDRTSTMRPQPAKRHQIFDERGKSENWQIRKGEHKKCHLRVLIFDSIP